MEKVVIVETSDVGAAYTADAVRELGYEPVFLAQRDSYQADTARQLETCGAIDCETSSTEQVLRAIGKHVCGKIAAVTSLLDSRLRVVTEVSSELKVRGSDPAIASLKSKSDVQELVPEFSPTTVPFGIDCVPVDAIRRILPAIVKPAEGAGGLGAWVVRDESELMQIAEKIHQSKLPMTMDTGRFVAQQFVNGRLVSVEGLVADRNISIYGFSLRSTVGMTETQNLFPAERHLSSTAMSIAVRAMHALVQRSGFANGSFHAEFIFGEDSAFLIDANMGRPGGGGIVEQLALSSGLKPAEIVRQSMAAGVFNQPLRCCELPALETVSIMYGVARGGTLGGLVLPDVRPCFHTQILGGGTHVDPIGINNWGWVGIATDLASQTEELVRRIQVEIDSDWASPEF